MVNVALMFTGAVLIVNGLSLLGKIDARSGAVLNLFVGSLNLAVAMIVGVQGDSFTAGKLLLFAFTYLWVAYNALMRVDDGRAFGWYCLFVAALAFPTAFITFDEGSGWFGVFWLSWGALWFVFFLLLALDMKRLTQFAGVATLFIALATCMIPGYLLVAGQWSG